MRLHHQSRAFLMEPSAPITASHFDEIHGPVMLRDPIPIIDFPHRPVYQHDAPWPQQRHHSPVAHADISIEVLTMSVREYTLKLAPLFHHPRQEFRSPRIERRIESHGYPQRSRRRHQMGLWDWERRSIMETLLDGDIVPAKNFQRVQAVDGSERVQFVQPRHNSTVLNIRQPADVQYELGASSARGQFVAGALHISIR